MKTSEHLDPSTARTFGKSMLPEWPLEPSVTYLNHGTVGVTPHRILAAQQAIRDDIERRPSDYLLRELTSIVVGRPRPDKPRMRQAADVVAEFLGARGNDLVFVDNATTGANAVLRSFPLEPGDGSGDRSRIWRRDTGGLVRRTRAPGRPANRGHAVSGAFVRGTGGRDRRGDRSQRPGSR